MYLGGDIAEVSFDLPLQFKESGHLFFRNVSMIVFKTDNEVAYTFIKFVHELDKIYQAMYLEKVDSLNDVQS